MPNYHRPYVLGGTYFFTVVTYNRQYIFQSELTREFLRLALLKVQERLPFTIDAICLLPDHLHCIWTLPEEDSNYSLRWGEIKKYFSKTYNQSLGLKDSRTASRKQRGEAAIWQRRFWEHLIRDEADYKNHLNYLHYNPVKHGLAKSPRDWAWSSFHRYVTMGYYDLNWVADLEEINKITE